MNHFSPKMLTFYGVAIAAVVLLFNRVTAYGEANLKAPGNIEGLYQLKAQNLPSCFKSNSPVLKVSQSGVYLTGSLSEDMNRARAAASSEQKPSLTGQWQNGKLSLSGPITQTACPPDTQMQINGSINKTRLSGQVSFNGKPAQFTAQRAPEDQPSQAAH